MRLSLKYILLARLSVSFFQAFWEASNLEWLNLLSFTHMTHFNLAPSSPEIGTSFKAKANSNTTLEELHFLVLSLIISCCFFIPAMKTKKKKMFHIFYLSFLYVLCWKIFLYMSMRHIWKMELILSFKTFLPNYLLPLCLIFLKAHFYIPFLMFSLVPCSIMFGEVNGY